METKRVSSVLVVLSLFALTLSAQAVVTPLAQYHGGEEDPGAVAGTGLPLMGDGNPEFGTFEVINSSGNLHNLVGGANVAWSADVPPAALLKLGASTLSYNFTTSYLYRAVPGGTVAALTNNVGLEVWVKARTLDVGDTYIPIVHNGQNDGIGFLQHGNTFIGHLAGVDFVGSTPVTAEWTHLAIVVVDGTTKFYVNGRLNAKNPNLPTAATGVFLIGAGVYASPITSYFDGLIDEVRVFSFNPGEFSEADLNYVSTPSMTGDLTNLAWYRGGEADAGAVAGGVPTPSMNDDLYHPSYRIINSSGNTDNDLIGGGITWSADVPPAAKLRMGPSTLSYSMGMLYRTFDSGQVTNLNDNVGMECWVKPLAGDQHSTIIHNGSMDYVNQVSNGMGLIQNGTVFMGHLAGSTVVGSAPVVPNAWTHLAIITDTGAWGGTRFYVNGKLNSFVPSGPFMAPTGVFMMGGNPYDAGGAGAFSGLVDEVRVFTFPSGKFHADALNYVPTPSTTGNLTNLAWYRGGEADAGAVAGTANPPTNDDRTNPSYRFVDSTGNTNNDLIGGGILWSDDVPPTAKLHLGPSTLSYSMGYLYRTIDNDLVTTLNDNVGIECWVKSFAAEQNTLIVHNGSVSSGAGVANGIGLIQNGSAFMGHLAGYTVVGSAPVVPNEWTHLAVVTDTGAWGGTRLYVNGQISGFAPGGPFIPPTGVFAIGADVYTPGGAGSFSGLIDETRVFTFKSGSFLLNDLNYEFAPPGATQFIVKPTNSGATSDPYPILDSKATFDGSGLSSDLKAGDPVPSVWPTNNDSVAGNWLDDGNSGSTAIEWDLGGEFEITGFHMWNYNQIWDGSYSNNRGLQSADIFVSLNWSADNSTYTPLGTMTFTAAPETSADGGVTYTFAHPIKTRMIKFMNCTSFSGMSVGMGEIRFIASTGLVPVIPGDANKDGKVDVSDLGILAANYGKTSGATWATGDFNGDGKVDVSDLGILAANYGRGTGGTLDFNKDAKAFGLVVESDQPAAKEDVPAISGLGCGTAGLPLIAGLLLMGVLMIKLEE